VYLLKYHNCRIKLGYKVAIFVEIWALLKNYHIHQQLQSVAERVERIWWLFFDLQKMSHSGITGGLRKASIGTRSVRKRPWPVSNIQYQDPFTRLL